MNQHSESPTTPTPLEGPIGVVGGGAVGGWLATQMKNHGWDVLTMRWTEPLATRQ